MDGAAHVLPRVRLDEVDFAKGVMIALMVFGHTTHVGSAAPLFSGVVSWIYTFHMPAFMVISGYFVTSGRSIRDSLVTTTRRILVPYCVFESLYLCGLYGASRLGLPVSNELGDRGPGGLLRHVVVEPIGAYWYLHALSIYLLAHHAAEALSGGRAVRRWALLAFLLVTVVASPVAFRLQALLFFSLGTALREAGSRLPADWMAVPLLALLAFVFQPATLKDRPEVSIVWVLAVLAFVQQLAIRWPRGPTPLLSFVGRNTLVILVLHPAVLNALKPMQATFLGIDPSGALNSVVAVLAGVALPIGAAALSDRLRTSALLFGSQPAYRPLAS
jgi:fucose 4-O-acetylase-like acetyltransferase